jgi:5-deoxy-glucuronate isomerase
MSVKPSLVRTAARDAGSPVLVDITPFNAGWGWSGLRVLELGAGDAVSIETQGNEMLVLPLSGAATVHCGAEDAELSGRASVFDAVTDFAYIGRDRVFMLSSEEGGRFALPAARAGRGLPFRYVAAADVSVEIRAPVRSTTSAHPTRSRPTD